MNQHRLLSRFAASLPGFIPVLLALCCLSGLAHADGALDEWRREAAATRTLAENDVPRAQDEALRLQAQLPAAALPADKAQILNLLARIEFNAAQTEASERHAQQALQLAKQNADPVGQAEAYLTLSVNAISEGKIDTLVDTTTRALEVLQGVDKPGLLGEAMMRAAMMDWRIGKIEASVILCIQAMDIAKRSNDPLALLYAHQGLALAYMQNNTRAEGMDQYMQMRDLARGMHMKQREAEAIMGMSNMHADLGNLRAAESDNRKAILLFREVGAPFSLASALFSLADKQRRLGHLSDSLGSLGEVVALYQRYPNKIGMWWTLDARSENLQALGRFADAQADARRAYALAKDIGLPLYQSKSAQRLAAIAAALGDHRRAYELSVEAAALTAKQLGDKSSHLMDDLAQRYQEDSKQRQIDELNQQNQLQHARHLQMLTALGGSIILLATTAYFLLRLRGSNVQLRLSQKQVHALNASLEQRVQDQTAELRIRERELSSLAESSPGMMGSFHLRPDGSVCMPYVSQNIWELFGLHPQDVTDDASPLMALNHPDDAQRVFESITESARSMTPWREEYRIMHPTLGERWMEGHTKPHPHPDGGVVWYGYVHDITRRKHAQQRMELLDRAINLSSDAIYLIDEQYRFNYVNVTACRALGYTQEELLSMTPADIDPDVTLEQMRAGGVRGTLVSGTARFESRHRKKDGRVFPIEISAAHIEEGGARFSLCVVRDISERKEMELAREAALSEAVHLGQLRSAFLAQMSHELRTPLNGILGYTQNLLLGDGLGAEQVSGLNIIRHSGEHLLSVINGILDQAAIDADKLELIPGDIRLEEFLSMLIAIIRVRAEQKNIEFVCEAEPSLPGTVRGDAQRLRQVLLNLLSNAIKFTDFGRVTLRVSRSAPSRLRFEVRDSGVGIPQNQLENIFLPFEQVGEISRRAGGSGLGLAISRKLVQMMGGDIKVESQLGGGSTFWFEIEMVAVLSDSSAVNVAALSEQSTTRVAQASSQLMVPPMQELDILHGLAQRGSMREVMRRVEQLLAQDERYRLFCEQLRQLAKNFQTKMLLNLIEQYRKEQGTP